MSDASSTFDRLHPSLRRVIAANLGWRELRPIQEAAIPAILRGSTTVVTAPTAGGKTEAATLPLLSRLIDEGWMPTSILYLAPLRALLNDLGERLGELCEYAGLRAEVWHGDVGQRERRRIAGSPPDILLTTPESLEVLLSMASGERHALILGLQSVVVDEAHAFYGIDRGTQLLALLERLQFAVERDVQRIALSATIGNPADLGSWLRGSSGREVEIVKVARSSSRTEAFDVTYRESLAGVANAVAKFQDEKLIAFCRTRSDAEELAHALAASGHSAWAHHSALSKVNREDAEREFREARSGMLVATSTLELGIDIGDLDRVVQVDAPMTVASLLQRLGRSGRRGGTAKMSFVATNAEQLLLVFGLLTLHADGWVEPLVPPWQPFPVLAQQILATVLQTGGISRDGLIDEIERNAAFVRISRSESASVVDHLVAESILSVVDGSLTFGLAGEQRYSYRQFMELASVFRGTESVVVRAGEREVGTLDRWFIQEMLARDRSTFLLNGRAWNVERWPQADSILEVTGAATAEAPLFLGSGLVLSWPVMRSIRRILAAQSPVIPSVPADTAIGEQATRMFESVWEASRSQRLDRESSPLISDGATSQLYTYAGLRANRLVADLAFEAIGHSATVTNTSIRFKTKGLSAERLRERFAELSASDVTESLSKISIVPKAEAKFLDLLDEFSRRRFSQERAYDLEGAWAIFNAGIHVAQNTSPSVPSSQQ
jgi:ATP-dependent Lhr-like helicase